MTAILVIAMVIGIVFVAVFADSYLSRKKYECSIGTMFGQTPPEMERFELESVSAYWERFAEETPDVINKTTWSDLDMDNMFARLDACMSSVGKKRYNHVAYLLADLKHKKLNRPWLYKLLAILPVACIAIIFLNWPLGLVLFVSIAVLSGIIHYRVNRRIENELKAVNYLSSVLWCAQKILTLENEAIERFVPECKSSFGMFQSSMNKMSGLVVQVSSDMDAFLIYARYVFLCDIIRYNRVLDKISNIITGSNASEKLTFIKAVAINCILAQTIHTCIAKHWCMHPGHVMTSMAFKDDLGSGESYFIAEIRWLKRILDYINAKSGGLCFIDEILKGTNAIERIAVSAALLQHLEHKNIVCFIASHDIELTELLDFRNFHFRERITEDGVVLDYLLREGSSKTRNAIRLRDFMGLDQSIAARADVLMEKFEFEHKWA